MWPASLRRLFPPPVHAVDKGHGRIEQRTLWTSTRFPNYQDFPYLQQVFRVERQTFSLGGEPLRKEIVFGITSLASEKADPARLLELNRGHWSIENRLHYVRDWTFDEDRSQVRKGRAAHAMATLRNLAISLLRLAGATTNIAAGLRFCARHVSRALRLIGLASTATA